MLREEIIAQATKIETLRAEVQRLDIVRKELRAAEKEFDKMLRGAGVEGLEPPPSRTTSGSAFSEQVREMLEREPYRSFSIAEITAAFPDVKTTTIHSTLSRLAMDGDLEKEGRGQYRIALSEATDSAEEEPTPRLVRSGEG